ncbi:YidC/Oxa1 family membrane protein insertase [Egibacter rhizosphaerae]|uniref:Membrane protein insertase YidC n=1 Tax=Egibacter rhizosphaerae TaxID=1670831 RepID=A0A411YFH8_9ACTN|nr:YidC/Oxa1 family membrane protein insertase [Egibacter rhizosphaerae]QBI20003.1 YidC/Oxa1 family membrane protein insertase [Egibacter rhizosphaerae]
MQIWISLLEGLESVLRFFQSVIEPVLPAYSWAVAIVLLTVAVRVLLLPLAVKQIRSMRAMQQLQPEMKKIQEKYKVDRSLMKTDPEKYKAKRQKQQEAMMALYKEHNVNPMAGCLPLLPQIPIFIALFWVLDSRSAQVQVEELETSGFILVESLSARAADGNGIGALVLVALMGITMFLTQKTMMAMNPQAGQNPQQKILMYVLPPMLTIFAFNFPSGVVLYWVTTNLWQMAQQWLMLRNVGPPPAQATTKPA